MIEHFSGIALCDMINPVLEILNQMLEHSLGEMRQETDRFRRLHRLDKRGIYPVPTYTVEPREQWFCMAPTSEPPQHFPDVLIIYIRSPGDADARAFVDTVLVFQEQRPPASEPQMNALHPGTEKRAQTIPDTPETATVITIIEDKVQLRT